MSAPNSYKDPFWLSLASNTESKLGLPEGLLSSIVTKGERSNADKVSEAGAKTVFQIIPQTRKAVLDKYGIDAYLSPENAAEVAGLLLKESLDRNKGDKALAVAEYHGGTNRENWGAKTKAYVSRVIGDQPKPQAQTSTFQRVMAAQPTENSAIQSIYSAYKAGKMTPEEVADFEADVKSGAVMLPRGGTLNNQPLTGPIVLNQGITDAYVSGKMSEQERAELEADIKAGLVKLPPSLESQIPTNAPGWTAPTEQQIIQRQPEPTVTDKLIGLGDAALTIGSGLAGGTVGMLGGTAKGIAQSVLDGSFGTPEAQRMVEKAAMEGASALTRQPATPQGAEYAKTASEALGQLAPVAPLVGEMQALGAGIKAGVPVARGMAEAAVAPKTVAEVPPVKPVAAAPAAPVAPAAPAAQATPAAQSPAAAKPAQQPIQELAATAKKAAEGGIGSKKATTVLAEQAAPNQKTVQAAERLGISEYLQPDHVTTNQAYRELAQAVKSIPGSSSRAAEIEGLAQVAKRGDDLITELGGTQDLSLVNQRIKRDLQSTQLKLEQDANKLYAHLREIIPAKAEAPAPSVIRFIQQRADDLGGKQNLSPTEKSILQKLGRGTPTYTLLDDVRRDLTAARIKAQGPFKDADTGLIKKLESELKVDQRAVVDRFGASEIFDSAQRAVAVRKGIENDLVSLFGKNIDGSIVGDLSGSIKALPSGDTSKFINMLKAIPESMRQETVASGLATAFGKNARNGSLNFSSYAKWYEGLLKNKQAHAALMTNLPPQARKQLSDLYRVSKGISDASRERITTGRIQAVTEELKGTDSLIGNIYGLAKRAAVGAAAEAVTTPMGIPGAGISAGIASALTKGKPNALKAADALISSPEFMYAAKQVAKGNTKSAAKSLSRSRAFMRFLKSTGSQKEVADKAKWIEKAIQMAATEKDQTTKKGKK